MKKYFYSNGEEKQGPFSLEEIKKENITKETLVWFEGLEDWKPAAEIEEFVEIFQLIPPPIENQPKINENIKICPKCGAEYLSNITHCADCKIELTDFVEKKVVKKSKPSMFSNVFSFKGRIRRTEYGISFIIYFILITFLNAILGTGDGVLILLFAYIPMLWFLWAQGAKRCHDLGHNGWFQIIPFYLLWLIFADGKIGTNMYGDNPKGLNYV